MSKADDNKLHVGKPDIKAPSMTVHQEPQAPEEKTEEKKSEPKNVDKAKD